MAWVASYDNNIKQFVLSLAHKTEGWVSYRNVLTYQREKDRFYLIGSIDKITLNIQLANEEERILLKEILTYGYERKPTMILVPSGIKCMFDIKPTELKDLSLLAEITKALNIDWLIYKDLPSLKLKGPSILPVKEPASPVLEVGPFFADARRVSDTSTLVLTPTGGNATPLA